ncbi:phosphatidylserine decarboxylase family protein [Aquimarina sp. ERC-38]|uniref:phosphatidylserine decarboxylase family protein n=1 Tax=Aquimarina sp. ERC-38 TaxID=2949996 RepID=UPI00224645D3|nr:phosphatidylserine decarboxylase family protein [Aquimarina sp. ERC-38]UZO80562.1 phosphatidylserine decarboxylase family protein [Aquimarina sp. ERC-38]
MFHKEGYKIIAVVLILFLGINVAAYIAVQDKLWISLIFFISLVFAILILQFFRNPKRLTVADDLTLVSPVDGKVVVIEEVFEKEYFKDNRIQVSIFMSPLNVHVTRHPIGGIIQYSKYHAGKYLVAWHPKASEENERTTVVVANDFITILYRQIAGALAKRIVNYAKPNESVAQGSDSGFIKFGSRVDVFLPLGTDIAVSLNQKVRGGESVIARIEK